jgi:hypothetical protein
MAVDKEDTVETQLAVGMSKGKHSYCLGRDLQKNLDSAIRQEAGPAPRRAVSLLHYYHHWHVQQPT